MSGSYPAINYVSIDNKTYWQVGCSKCQKGLWELYSPDEGGFLVRCQNCGHTNKLTDANRKTEPDPVTP